MKIGLISDTHGYLDPKVLDYFASCDEIWHAGDIGDLNVMHQLEEIKKVKAVFGNIDTKDIQLKYPEDLRFKEEGLDIFITHIAGAPPRYNPRIKKILSNNIPDILICGHSHICRVVRDAKYNNLLYLNPGAAGNHGFHIMKTIMRFDIEEGNITNVEVIELGKRGLIK